jgi:CHAT domain-containing protein
MVSFESFRIEQEILGQKLQKIKSYNCEEDIKDLWRYLDPKYVLPLLLSLENEISILHSQQGKPAKKLKKALELGIATLGFNRKKSWKDENSDSLLLVRQCLIEIASITELKELDSFADKRLIAFDKIFYVNLYYGCKGFIHELNNKFNPLLCKKEEEAHVTLEDHRAAYAIVELGNIILRSSCVYPEIKPEMAILAFDIAFEEVYSKLNFNQLTKYEICRVRRYFLSLGRAYCDRIYGERIDNLAAAERCYAKALKLYNQYSREQIQDQIQDIVSTSYKLALGYLEQRMYENVVQVCNTTIDKMTLYSLQDPKILVELYFCLAEAEGLAHPLNGSSIQEAISYLEEAKQRFEGCGEECTEELMQLHNCLSIFYNGGNHDNRFEAVRLAILNAKEACKHYENLPTKIQEWPRPYLWLANALVNLEESDLQENLGRAIDIYEDLLERYSDLIPQVYKIQILNNLAIAYRNDKMGGKLDNLLKADSRMDELFKVTKNHSSTVNLSPENKAAHQNTWGNTSLHLAIEYQKDPENRKIFSRQLTKAIEHFRNGLKILENEGDLYFKLRADICVNLAHVYLQFNEETHFKRSEEYCQKAIDLYHKTQSPRYYLAHAYNNLAISYYGQGNLQNAISSFNQALEVFVPKIFPKDCLRVSYTCATVCESQEDWQSAADAYQKGINSLELLYAWSTTLNSKGVQISSARDIYRRAAYACARTENQKEAILILEQGRARGLSETIGRDRANLNALEGQNKDLCDKYKEIIQKLHNLEAIERDRAVSDNRRRTPEDHRNSAEQLDSDLRETIAQIRQERGYEDFLDIIEWKDIANPDYPLIYLVTTPNGSVTLILTPDNQIKRILSDFTETQLLELILMWFTAYEQREADFDTWLKTMDTITCKLWDSHMGEIIKYLKPLGITRATLIPTGFLSFFPLHVAWTEDSTGKHYALDDINFTYAPNARSLKEAKKIADRVKADAILAIDEPTHRHVMAPNEFRPISSLPHSSEEVTRAIRGFTNPNQKLAHAEATREAVLEVLPNINVLHCSCHGKSNFQEPLKSYLVMAGDGEKALLTLRHFLTLKLTDGTQGGIRLAILSACETGLPGFQNIDEVIGLPIGLLQAGVAGVISSLWSVKDDSTMILLSRFHGFWHDPDGRLLNEPAIAFHKAQQWMCSTTDDVKAEYVDRFLPPMGEMKLSHPYYWAAFTYLGV